MAKRKQEDDITGYVHSVSPVKTKPGSSSGHQVSYFNMTIQTAEDEFHRGVSFTTKDHESLETASSSKSPIKITAVEKPISRVQTGSFDVKLSKVSRILMMNQKDIAFKWREAPSMEAVEEAATLAEIADGSVSPHKTVVVEVKVLSIEDKGIKTAGGKPIGLKTALVADGTSTMELNIWGTTASIEVAKSYKLKANIRSFNNIISLSLKSGTVFEINAIATNVEETVVEGEAMAANIEKRHVCMKCKKGMDLSPGTISTCSKCGTKCKNKFVKFHMTGAVSFDGSTFYQLREDVLSEYVKTNDIEKLSSDEVQDHLLERENLKITLLNKGSSTVVKME